MYNPLLGHNLPDRTWYDIAEALQVKIAKLCMRNTPEQATYYLNVMDLIDTEASAYWREWGLDLYSGKIPEGRMLVRSCVVPRLEQSDIVEVSIL